MPRLIPCVSYSFVYGTYLADSLLHLRERDMRASIDSMRNARMHMERTGVECGFDISEHIRLLATASELTERGMYFDAEGLMSDILHKTVHLKR